MKSVRAAGAAILLAFITIQVGMDDAQAQQSVTIAVVQDGPPADASVLQQLQLELEQVSGDRTAVTLLTEPQFNADWDPTRMREVLEAALSDRRVDIVLATGPLVLQEASRPGLNLTKPVVSSVVQLADLFKLPSGPDERSLKQNLSFVMVPAGVDRALETFRELIPFTAIHVAVDAATVEQLETWPQLIGEYEQQMGVRIQTWKISGDVSESMAGLGEDVEAVLLGRTPRLSHPDRQRLMEQLTARGLPTFSLVGHADVEMGALAGITPDFTQQAVRRMALNLNQIMRGTPTGELPVLLPLDSELMINGRTAAAIGYMPSVLTRASATILFEEALASKARRLMFPQVLAWAPDSNAFLAVTDAALETVRRQKQLSGSPLLPQILADGSYANTDWASVQGAFPDEITRIGVSLQQMIYDDRRISDYRSSSRYFEAREFEREARRLDVLADAGRAYLNLALAQVLYDVKSDNVSLTKDNLELAELRYDVGYSGKDEIYRWEAELALRQSQLFDAEMQVDASRIALNQVLGQAQDQRWWPDEIEVSTDVFYFLGGEIDPVYSNPAQWRNFREAMVQYALQHDQATNLAFLQKATEAQGIQYGQRKRRWFLPTFTAGLWYSYVLDRDPPLGQDDKDAYRFELRATYPIFEGAGRHYEAQRAKSQVTEYERQQQLASQLVERRTRTSLSQVESSYPVIRFTRAASESADLSLDLVRERYAQGLVNVTDLLEAQNQAFVAQRSAVAANYDHLMDLVEFQRSISWFEDERTLEDREEFLQWIEAALIEPQP